ncbi:MAG: twin-arginine translocase TatA/TatE family subunit [Nocardioidaceae bacterium]
MDLGAPELLLIFLVVLLLFGAKKLPEIARGTGRALRIFKAEVSASDDRSAQTPPTATAVRSEDTEDPGPRA